jgi:lipopolysaccharide transport system ATP-binding protein
MSKTIIKVENISKAYQIGQYGTGTISMDIERWWATKVRRKEDPFLKIGENHNLNNSTDTKIVWPLKNIDFEVKQGEVLGIIGKNGAGKSTLLKILSRVTTPTSGSIKMKGRIASLLEVGTGFHPELTGRENIFMNGAILGMRKFEISQKLDEIISFSGVERYIDTPVKRYSSGMYVRLAFAVAAHLDSEILIVDEVLAVGDAEFQKKCLGKMNEFSKEEGRSVLFVSHNIDAVQTLCDRGILLGNGTKLSEGNIDEVLQLYTNRKTSKEIIPNSDKFVYLTDLIIHDENNKSVKSCGRVFFDLHINSKDIVNNVIIGIGINNLKGSRIITPFSKHSKNSFTLKKGKNVISCELPFLPLKPDIYTVEIYIGTEHIIYDYYNKDFQMDITYTDEKFINYKLDNTQGNIIVDQLWKQI